MLYSATIILFILVEAKHGSQGQWFPLLLAAWLGKEPSKMLSFLLFCLSHFMPPGLVQRDIRFNTNMNTLPPLFTITNANTAVVPAF